LELNDTTLIDEAVSIFCKEYKLLDEDVCIGATNEYTVKNFIDSFQKKKLLLFI